ncbi:MAG TPA: FecR family protein [Dongiaceae bacterium]|nr:FecR family protein [Dongiaceae bacterium]
MRHLIATGLAAGLTLALAGAAFGSEVGDVQAVERSAFGTPPDASKEPKRAGDPVAFKELLETLTRSGMLVRFSDGSKLTLGADSKVLVDDFVYDPGNPTSKALISLPAGKLRYVTGSMPKGQTTIDTPNATMVLRGTNVAVDSRGDDTLLYVEEGSVSVHSKLTGQDTLVKEGESVLIGANGIVSTSIERTGDPLVDDGFGGGNPVNGQNERRRGEGGGHHETTKSSGDSGGNSGGTGGSGSYGG